MGRAAFILVLAAAGLATACATRPVARTADAESFLQDDAFPGARVMRIETPEEIFALDDAARAHVDRTVNTVGDIQKRSQALLKEVLNAGDAGLIYEVSANTTANDTFHKRVANCLSLAVLTYAMAKHAGFEVEFQEVVVPDYWERRNSFNVMSEHINVRLSLSPDDPLAYRRHEMSMVVDFQPAIGMAFPSRPVATARVVAMFYNNKGAEALLAGHHDLAYAYFKGALNQDPTLDMALANLGLLYGRHGKWDLSERALRAAVQMDPHNSASLENLATVLRHSGDRDEAKRIGEQLERMQRNNAYFYFREAETAFEHGSLQDAVQLYKKAIDLKRDASQFHFGLAKTYFRQGDLKRAESELRAAERYATYNVERDRYRGKIDALSAL